MRFSKYTKVRNVNDAPKADVVQIGKIPDIIVNFIQMYDLMFLLIDS